MSRNVKIMTVFGTRPEAIKMAPLVHQIEKEQSFESIVCVTGQHREMLRQVLDVFGITPHYNLDLMQESQTITDITVRVLLGMQDVLQKAAPDIVLVHGDTTTSFAAALAAFYRQVPVGHVEAGLRTNNIYSPFPEEMNRNLVTKLATLHFAPTKTNAKNLQKENICNNVFITGNTVIDALLEIVDDKYRFADPVLQSLNFNARRTVLITMHRRENLGEPMREVFKAVREIVEKHPDIQLVYPVHKNPLVQQAAKEFLSGHPRIFLIEPLAVNDMHNLMARSYIILTDSGGLQEEAPSLGKPVLVLRTETERPEAVKSGVVKVVGVNRVQVYREINRLLNDPQEYSRMAAAQNPYGDGRASRRICEAIKTYFAQNKAEE